MATTHINKGSIDVVRARSIVLKGQHHTRVVIYIYTQHTWPHYGYI